LTRSLPLSRPAGLPVYVARVPAAPFCETPDSASGTDALEFVFACRRDYGVWAQFAQYFRYNSKAS